MGFANQPAVDTSRAQMIAQSKLADLERDLVVACTMALHIAARICAHPRGAADGRLNIGTVKAHALACEPVNVWGVKMWMTIAAQVVPAQLVKHDEENVFFV